MGGNLNCYQDSWALSVRWESGPTMGTMIYIPFVAPLHKGTNDFRFSGIPFSLGGTPIPGFQGLNSMTCLQHKLHEFVRLGLGISIIFKIFSQSNFY